MTPRQYQQRMRWVIVSDYGEAWARVVVAFRDDSWAKQCLFVLRNRLPELHYSLHRIEEVIDLEFATDDNPYPLKPEVYYDPTAIQ